MKNQDKDQFAKKLYRTARAMDRNLTSDTVDTYFNELKSFPIEVVEKAIDLVMDGKSKTNDLYVQRMMPIIPEIKQEAREIIDTTPIRAGCEKCNWTGYIIEESKGIGQPTAKRCECFQNIKSKGEPRIALKKGFE